MFCTLVPNIYKIQCGYTVSDTSRVVYISAYLYNNVLFTFPVVCWRKVFLKWNLFYWLVSQLQPYGIFFSHMKRNLNMNVYCTVHNVTEIAVFFRNFKELTRYLLFDALHSTVNFLEFSQYMHEFLLLGNVFLVFTKFHTHC